MEAVMSTRDAYLGTVKAKVDDWNAGIETFIARDCEASADALLQCGKRSRLFPSKRGSW